MIVNFRGIDSSEKSTQIELLNRYKKKNNIKVRKVWGKARGTPGVVFIKNLLRNDKNMSFEEKMEYRQEVFNNTKKKKLLLFASLLDLCWYFGIYYRILNIFNQVLICDRYIWDTYIEVKNEFIGVDIDKWFIWKLALFLTPKPNKSLMFVIPAEESISSDIQKKDLTVDSLELKNNKINLYMDLVKQGKWITVIDGLQPIEEIHKKVLEVIGLEN